MLALVFLPILLNPSIAAAQAPATGVIRGVVLEASDGAPAGTVSVRLEETSQTVITDEAGRFQIPDVAPGAHELTGKAGGPSVAVPSAQVLRGKDLQQFRGLVTNDPFRAIQVLPGVATGDDLKSEFTVRGGAIDHMVFTFEGVAAPFLVHTVQRVGDTGSLAMVNGDILDEVSLAGGS